MKISDLEKKKKNEGKRLFSLEIFPPKGDLTETELAAVLDGFKAVSPDYISVTCSAGGSGNSGKTVILSQMVKTVCHTDAMAHLTCVNSTRNDIDEKLAELKFAGIENILALRGDLIDGNVPRDFKYASDLIPIIVDNGFCVCAGCYPEGHVDCDDPDKDIEVMKIKEDMGVCHFISQLFFEDKCFAEFIDKIKKAGIKSSVSAGIMPIMSSSQITRMVFTCGASLPAEIVRILHKYEKNPEDLRKAGVEYAAKQVRFITENTDCPVHLYAMNKPDIALAVCDASGIR